MGWFENLAGLNRLIRNPPLPSGFPVRSVLAAILLLALLLRLAAGYYLGLDAPPDRAAMGADTVEMEAMGRSAALGQGFRIDGQLTAFRSPGYPALIAGLYMVFGTDYYWLRLANALMGALSCWLVFWLARRLGLNAYASLAGALITAVLPSQVYYAGHIMSEVPAAFFVTLSACLLVGAVDRCLLSSQAAGSRCWLSWGIVAGLALGAAAAIKPPLVLALPLILLGGLMLRHLRSPRLLPFIITAGVSLCVLISPWVVRNYMALDRFCLFSTNGGSTFWGANNPITADPQSGKWGYWVTTNLADPERKKAEVLVLENEVDRDQKEWQLGLEYLASNPDKLPVLLTGKLLNLITPLPHSSNWFYKYLMALGEFPLLLFSLLGFITYLRRRNRLEHWLPMFCMFGVLLATALIFYGSMRFRMPFGPLMAVLGACWLSAKPEEPGV